MIQADILLRRLPDNFCITFDNDHPYDLILKDRQYSFNVYISHSMNAQGIYGNEAKPIIFHLPISEGDCLLNISLINAARDREFLFRYDDCSIEQLDDYFVSTLERGGGYNFVSLRNNAVSVGTTIRLKTDRKSIDLLDGYLHEYDDFALCELSTATSFTNSPTKIYTKFLFDINEEASLSTLITEDLEIKPVGANA